MVVWRPSVGIPEVSFQLRSLKTPKYSARNAGVTTSNAQGCSHGWYPKGGSVCHSC